MRVVRQFVRAGDLAAQAAKATNMQQQAPAAHHVVALGGVGRRGAAAGQHDVLVGHTARAARGATAELRLQRGAGHNQIGRRLLLLLLLLLRLLRLLA